MNNINNNPMNTTINPISYLYISYDEFCTLIDKLDKYTSLMNAKLILYDFHFEDNKVYISKEDYVNLLKTARQYDKLLEITYDSPFENEHIKVENLFKLLHKVACL